MLFLTKALTYVAI